ncbi:basic helix-loop-helix (bHLH) DNA-bindingsuperfamily protein [Striga asiatica]|uniref:Basic helix-loop-helix (BHLH) DNA-bindingsuperfamily protein n=1 Tax=Striga asiatica TaxID=4170 RepID=A0A5A7QSI1_STRAF|nr:basic helix-loop-helix (bHLH) DNA-bindingsuperfamily protein [Striga asiatica]
MMAGNPNWWGMINDTMHSQSHHHQHQQQLSSQFPYVSNSDQLSSSNPSHSNSPDFPVRSWSQLLLGGLANSEEERFGANVFQQQKKVENWEDQVMLNLNNDPSSFATQLVSLPFDAKQEVSQTNCRLFYGGLEDGFDANNRLSINSWPNSSHQVVGPVSSPTSCVTTLSGNILNFSKSKNQILNQDRSSKCNSTGDGGASKKARITHPSAQPALKVRKEKLGDRISTLHQLVSPFGKTDTASVLSEAIGYIRFLQGQIEALSSPYMRNAAESSRNQQHSDSQGVKDLRSRGLCLVPIDCTQHVGSEIGADYWAPAAFGAGF